MPVLKGWRDKPYVIKEREVYDKLKVRGIDPLFWIESIFLAPEVRKEIQEEIFGKGNHQAANQKFYKLAWGHKEHHKCEECMKPLPNYSASFVSHMLSRGAYPEAAYDLRNFNILCKECHARWENGDRENMKIFQRNNYRMKFIKKDYETLKNKNS